MALITGTSQVSVNIQGYYDRNLLKRALPALIHGRFCQVRPLPANSGTRINFKRFNSLPANTTKLQEGVTPTGKQLTETNLYATIGQYGDFIIYSDLVSMTTLDPLLLEMGDVLGEQMGLTADTLDRDVMNAGTTVRYTNGVAGRSTVATTILTADLKSVTRMLETANARKIKEAINAGGNVGTVPVPRSFYAITHTDCRQNYEALSGFVKVEEYASQTGVLEEEIGKWGIIRVLATSNAKVWIDSGVALGATGLVTTGGSNVDVYSTIVLAADALGTTPLQKGNIKNIVKKVGSSGVEDALDQRGSSGWKIAKVTKILNDDLFARIEHGVTDL